MDTYPTSQDVPVGKMVPFDTEAPAGTLSSRHARRRQRLATVAQRLRAWRRTASAFCLRIDVLWTSLFFVLLVITAAITTSAGQVLISRNMLQSLHQTHAVRFNAKQSQLSNINTRVKYIAAASLSIHLRESQPMNSPFTLASLCSTLKNFGDIRFSSLLMYSRQDPEGVGCMWGASDGYPSTILAGFYSTDHIIRYSYLVDNNTYGYAEPTVIIQEWGTVRQNLSNTIPRIYGTLPVFDAAAMLYNKTITTVEQTLMWQHSRSMPHFFFYNLPIGFVASDVEIPAGRYVDDFVSVCLDGSQLMLPPSDGKSADFSAALFIDAHLANEHPSVLSNNWGQVSVHDYGVFAPASSIVTYLTTDNISDPLMRAAIRHVDFKGMRTTGYNVSTVFHYKGAPAVVTAVRYVTTSGLVLPLVMVSAQCFVTPPYLHYQTAANVATATAIVVATGLFWLFVHHEYSAPLQRMTQLLRASVLTGERELLAPSRGACVQLRESAALMRVFNNCMRRLRQIDAFVPRDVRALFFRHRASLAPTATSCDAATSSAAASPRCVDDAASLRSQCASVVYVNVEPPSHASAKRSATPVPHSQQARHGQRLAAVVERTARDGRVVHCGPFPSADALSAFVTAAQGLARIHRGSVHRIAPDRCVFHFGRAVRTHLRSPATLAATQCATAGELAPEEQLNAAMVRREGVRCARQDAMDALRFALALQKWVDGCGSDSGMPNTHALVDTGSFVCGQYCAQDSEHTMAVALGRDVHRELGHVAALIGARVMMTEETSSRVRARVPMGVRRELTDVGVRQLPVEALRTGRVGLDANVVILYEVLPGPVVGDAAWQRYSRCCFDGFAMMLRGDYAGALCAYENVMAVADLEPGLMPPTLRREAARSSATGGAVSAQVARLMRECQRRIARGITTGYYRERIVPLGIDAVLRHVTPAGVAPEVHLRAVELESAALFSFTDHRAPRRTPLAVEGPSSSAWAQPRLVVTLPTAPAPLRCVVGAPPVEVRDSRGSRWTLQHLPGAQGGAHTPSWSRSYTCLGDAGVLCSLRLLPFRRTTSAVRRGIAETPDGVLPDALSAVLPVAQPTRAQRAACAALFSGQEALCHPNLVRLLGYSLSVEGGAAVMLPISCGESSRQVFGRYGRLSAVTMARFSYEVFSALDYLHGRGLAHGRLSPDTVLIGSDGVCRLRSHFSDARTASRLFALPATCYVSPAMAAGEAPTAACDVFCMGLVGIELFGRRRPWRWAAAAGGGAAAGDAAAASVGGGVAPEPLRTEAALEALMAAGGAAFSAAVVAGSVVPAVVSTVSPQMAEVLGGWAAELRRSVSYTPSERPTAKELREMYRQALLASGIVFADLSD